MSSTALPLATPRKELTIALLGSPSTGKTNFINRKIHNVFRVLYTPTLGDTYTTILRDYPDTVLTIIDLDGHDDVDSMRSMFLCREHIDGYVIVYAADDMQSWRDVGGKWWEEVERWNGTGESGRKGKIFVVGCKGDLIGRAGWDGFVESGGIICSALEGWGITEAWDIIIQGCQGE
ncbi:P-loop containing nucleoside triphosphate hydrolase protein [Tuber indicum]|nr:P-loop containing nucleoside triphosphate hydrolase protein [Tuber indicum]